MKQARVLNDKELRAVLNGTKLTRYTHRNRLMVMLSYCAGLRACEIASLRINDVMGSDGEAKHTILLERRQTKGKQREEAVVSEKLRKEITQYVHEHRRYAAADAPLLSESERRCVHQPDHPTRVSPAV
ncbi:MAG: tyrosine-type recombinase/integrase [Woeseiaceae bacterium]|nr:tyrosine-type recombinase/integrase [Woeseiaceae bacterium]